MLVQILVPKLERNKAESAEAGKRNEVRRGNRGKKENMIPKETYPCDRRWKKGWPANSEGSATMPIG